MRRYLHNMLYAFWAMGMLVSCYPEEVMPEFSVSDIYGKWRSGSLYYRYDYDYEGVTWDESEDVYESEGQRFTWEIVGDDMTHIYIMEVGEAAIPKTYVIDELTPTVLRYHDYYKSYRFEKVY